MNQISTRRFITFSAPSLILFILFFLLPLLAILYEVTTDVNAFSRVLSDPLFRSGLWGTLLLGLLSPLFSVIIGFLVTLGLTRLKQSIQTPLLFAISLPLTFSGLIVAYGFILAFGRSGFITQLITNLGFEAATVGAFIFSPVGLGFAYSYYLIPRVVMIMMPALQSFDNVQLAVAQSLGANAWKRVIEIMLPQVMPSLISAFCLTSAVAMGAYGTALALVGTQLNILPLLLYSKVSEGGTDLPSAAVISLILMTICCCIIALGELFTHRKNHKKSS